MKQSLLILFFLLLLQVICNKEENQIPKQTDNPIKQSNSSYECKLLFLSTYPPEECGIAKYCQKLIKSMEEYKLCKIDVISLSHKRNLPHNHTDDHVIWHVPIEDVRVYPTIGSFVKEANYSVVIIQHEFGIFPLKDNLKKLLTSISAPVISILHSARSNPSFMENTNIKMISKNSDLVIALSKASYQSLQTEYEYNIQNAVYIPHPATTVNTSKVFSAEIQKESKMKLGVGGNTKVITSIGIIHPNKGIQKIIKALPNIYKAHQNIHLYIVGKPSNARLKGVLLSLIQKVDQHEKLITFIPHFVNNSLFETIMLASDLIITPYDQCTPVSGIVSTALGYASIIVSTPFNFAQEVLSNNTGIILKNVNLLNINTPLSKQKYLDPIYEQNQIKELTFEINEILKDDPQTQKRRSTISKNAYRYAEKNSWNAISKMYLCAIFKLNDNLTKKYTNFCTNNTIWKKYDIKAIDRSKLKFVKLSSSSSRGNRFNSANIKKRSRMAKYNKWETLKDNNIYKLTRYRLFNQSKINIYIKSLLNDNKSNNTQSQEIPLPNYQNMGLLLNNGRNSELNSINRKNISIVLWELPLFKNSKTSKLFKNVFNTICMNLNNNNITNNDGDDDSNDNNNYNANDDDNINNNFFCLFLSTGKRIYLNSNLSKYIVKKNEIKNISFDFHLIILQNNYKLKNPLDYINSKKKILIAPLITNNFNYNKIIKLVQNNNQINNNPIDEIWVYNEKMKKNLKIFDNVYTIGFGIKKINVRFRKLYPHKYIPIDSRLIINYLKKSVIFSLIVNNFNSIEIDRLIKSYLKEFKNHENVILFIYNNNDDSDSDSDSDSDDDDNSITNILINNGYYDQKIIQDLYLDRLDAANNLLKMELPFIYYQEKKINKQLLLKIIDCSNYFIYPFHDIQTPTDLLLPMLLNTSLIIPDCENHFNYPINDFSSTYPCEKNNSNHQLRKILRLAYSNKLETDNKIKNAKMIAQQFSFEKMAVNIINRLKKLNNFS
ncbi:hypothetical protein M0813_21747 [Anaeramoeba flamelloides]|uniref:Glycosyl transferase family 1 domain-containing protein n=1 Tax=Anaeramoeba flamelloides TaxID=1746091 RepID=A0ABQ8YHB1_9EUKA|nr:hypothetical protein M0813_21747 [Anaeramoeba flamelloides]